MSYTQKYLIFATSIFILILASTYSLLAQERSPQNPRPNQDDCSTCIEQVFERPANYQDAWSRNGLTPQSQATAMQVIQQGTSHVTRVKQEDALRSAGYIRQNGSHHEADLYQIGSDLQLLLSQSGNQLKANLRQQGNNNLLDVRQNGAGQGIEFTQTGSGLNCIVTQRGGVPHQGTPIQIIQTN